MLPPCRWHVPARTCHESVAKGILTSLPSPGLNGIIIVSYTQGTYKCLIAGLQYIHQHEMNVGSQHSTFLWGCVDALCSSSTTRWWPFILARESAVLTIWRRIPVISPDISAITRIVWSMTDRYHTASHLWNVRN